MGQDERLAIRISSKLLRSRRPGMDTHRNRKLVLSRRDTRCIDSLLIGVEY